MKVHGYIIYFEQNFISSEYQKKGEKIMDGEFLEGGFEGGGIISQLARWTGTTVTIYTTSGGASGCGFTGVLILCDPCFVRLITCIGPAPCCSLGSSCDTCCCPVFDNCSQFGRRFPGSRFGGGQRNNFICNVGATVDIPVDRIVAFVHNAI
jgi:hypothetical protein